MAKFKSNNKKQRSNYDIGASLVEYGLLVSMLSMFALAGVVQTGESISCLFGKVGGYMRGMQAGNMSCIGGRFAPIPILIEVQPLPEDVAAPDNSRNGGVTAPIYLRNY